MGDLSRNFDRSEFACKCGCGMDTVDTVLIHIMQEIRTRYDTWVTINSGNRCYQRNLDEGGFADSQHMLSKACDFVVVGVGACLVQADFEEIYPTRYGMGRYKNRTHVDSRDLYARW
jgi:uncharacterized protein YcbK (DUF882 family)